MPTPPLHSRDDDEHGAPPATVAPVAWAVVDATGAFWDAAPLSSKEYADKRVASLNRKYGQIVNTPYRVVPLYDADVPALMARIERAEGLLREARGRLAPLPSGVPGTLAHRIDAALGREGA